MTIEIRDAGSEDIAAIASVARAAWRDTYAEHLKPETIEGFLERAYSPARIERRVDGDTFLLAVEDGEVVAFCDARELEDRVALLAIYALPERRSKGAGTAMLVELRRRFPTRWVAAEVLEGNRKGEVFYERRGFEPRERLDDALFGEPIVERRWWLAPDIGADAEGGVEPL
jgi:GNAT superfamily N-acetyltransferase